MKLFRFLRNVSVELVAPILIVVTVFIWGPLWLVGQLGIVLKELWDES